MFQKINKYVQALRKLAFKTGAIPVQVNLVFELDSGEKVYVDSEDEDLVGDSILKMDAEGMPTQETLPDGAVTIKSESGTSFQIEVANGVVQSQTQAQAKTPEEEAEELAKKEAEELAKSNSEKEENEVLAKILPLMEQFASKVLDFDEMKSKVEKLEEDNKKMSDLLSQVNSKTMQPPAVPPSPQDEGKYIPKKLTR
jgi:hypothetical protein